jgi:flavin-dependent thymidylate synthase
MTSNHTNSVILLGSYGSDKTHALSAWCSTFQELGIEIPKNVPDRIDSIFNYLKTKKKKSYNALIGALAADGHHTPFEKSMIHFLVTSDVASHIHKLKHRIGVSLNSESARYKELTEDKFYIPVDWSIGEQNLLIKHAQDSFAKYHEVVERLTLEFIKIYQDKGINNAKAAARKRAKESARYYLPYCMQYTVDLSFNFRSFMHFQLLRNSEHAQVEIRSIAKAMLSLVSNIKDSPFKYSLEAFGYFDIDIPLMLKDGDIPISGVEAY